MTFFSRYSLVLPVCFWVFDIFASPIPALVDNIWLAKNKANVVVLDIRSNTEFIRGHWPNSRWAGFKALNWQVKRYGVPGYLPREKKLSELLGNLGLSGSESIVVIGSAERPERIAEAARVVWSLMIAGFHRVALLDGGIESLPTDSLNKGISLISSTDCNISIRTEFLATTNRVEGLLDNNGSVVDFRPTLYFEGYKRNPQVPLGGTILDAIGFPPERLIDGDSGRFQPVGKIKQEFKNYAIPTNGRIITFSDTGIWAALGWFVLHRILENPQARLYDGSLVEWIDWGGEIHDSTDDMGGPIG